jgi:hypothetical protein
METMILTAPSCWACYFINGDASGLTDEEQRAADAWHDREHIEVLSTEGEEYFTNNLRLHAPEAGFSAGTVIDYVCTPRKD